MRVVFLSPRYPPEMIQFTRGLAEVGAEVLGVGDGRPIPSCAAYLSDYLEVPSLIDEADVIRARPRLAARPLDRSRARELGAARDHGRAAARAVRHARHVRRRRPRLSRQAAHEGARRSAPGLRVPRSRRVRTESTTSRARVEEIGYPLIIKPIAGAGSADTYKVDDARRARAASCRTMRHVDEASCEEYIDGEEFTYDTVCIDGKPVYENVAAVPAERRSRCARRSGSRRSS